MSNGATVLLVIPSSSLEHVLLLAVSFLFLLAGAEVFTNSVEWLGYRLGVSESATGSILAAVGTALPETVIPLIAIFGSTSGSTEATEGIGIGAILGAPFMLATIAMFLVGSSVLYFSKRRTSGREMHFSPESTRRDLSCFLVGFTLAFLAALTDDRTTTLGIGVLLMVLYIFYLYRSLQSGGLPGESELDDLFFGSMAEKALSSLAPPRQAFGC
ncbi:sodium:calcium antiporter [Haladaptatus sp. CMAA 1911]|uniref:sodium:calcium antiporter n=1 Tax=unclassified Haladaptatus TaxID=2622732 RepID=UPI003754ED89